MAKKDFLARQKERERMFLDVGLQCGRQQIMDMLSIVLNDPEVMKKDTFGRERLMIIVKAISDRINLYQPAWTKSDEADYYQRKLDEALSKIYGEQLFDHFHKRYEYAPEFDYVKGKWKK